MAVIAYLGLGSNLGDRLINLQSACGILGRQMFLPALSRVYETAPWGYTEQPAFLNQVVQVETDLAPLELLACVKQVEVNMGRLPMFRYGPRLIDIDLLFYGDQVVQLPELSVPHPRLHERAFVLAPLAELAPELRHPLLGVTVAELLAQVDQSGVGVFSETDKTATNKETGSAPLGS